MWGARLWPILWGGVSILLGLKEDFQEQEGFEQGHTERGENRISVDSPENTDKEQVANHEFQCVLAPRVYLVMK